MVIFMGSYSGGDNYDSTTDSTEETSEDDAQTGVDDFVERDDCDEGSGGANGGATVGAAGAGVVVATEPASEANDEDRDDGSDPEAEESDSERNNDPDHQKSDESDAADESEDEADDSTVVVVQEVDAFSAMSWCVQPVMKRITERYDDVEVRYVPAPIREFEDTTAMKERWQECRSALEMPVDPTVWDENPPESTERVTKAFIAAITLGVGEEYLRSMWREAIAGGRDIDDTDVLVELASGVGVDQEPFKTAMAEIEVPTGNVKELPVTKLENTTHPMSKPGRVRIGDFKPQFTFEGHTEGEAPQVTAFVSGHGPVATPEIMEVCEIGPEEARQRLEAATGVSSSEIGGEKFWDY